ncbi:MAG: LEPR-XLL domain-containing protein, partial [Syntrophobacterales bacterium]|nr:LEPR-XLL domain-containing protein [Syntrophobacterales bacterium]
MKKAQPPNQFEMETLEPRILLSGDALVGMAYAAAPHALRPLASKLASPQIEEIVFPAETKDSDSAFRQSFQDACSVGTEDLFGGMEEISFDDEPEACVVDAAAGELSLDAQAAESGIITETQQALLEEGLEGFSDFMAALEDFDAFGTSIAMTDGVTPGQLLAFHEVLDTRLFKQIYDYFGDATDPPTIVGMMQLLADFSGTGGAAGVKDGLDLDFNLDNQGFSVSVELLSTQSGFLRLAADNAGIEPGEYENSEYVASFEISFTFGLDGSSGSDEFFVELLSLFADVAISDYLSPSGEAASLYPLQTVSETGNLNLNFDVNFDQLYAAGGRLAADQLVSVSPLKISAILYIYMSENFVTDEPAAGSRTLTLSSASPLVLDEPLVIGAGSTLNGAGRIIGDVIVEGVLSPGNSPGVDEFDNLTLSGSLTMEIGGMTPGAGPVENPDNGYDQINVTDNIVLGGTLDISLINGFVPAAGQTFDIITFGSASGAFADATGLFGFGDNSLYFEIVQLDYRIQLQVKQVSTSGATIQDADVAESNALGKAFGGYFAGFTASVSVNLELAGFVSISGAIGVSRSESQIKVAGENVSAILPNGSFTAGVLSGNFALLLNDDGTRVTFANGSFALSGGNFANATGTVSVRENTTGLLFSAGTVTVGSVNVSVPELSVGLKSVSGTNLSFAINGFATLTGDLGFEKTGSTPDTLLRASAQNVAAKIQSGDFEVGVTNGGMGLVITEFGKVALEASGEFYLTGGGFAFASADSVIVRYNDSNVSYTGQSVSIGGVNYTFSNLPASTTLKSVSVSGLQATFSDVFTVGGNFGFEKSGTDVLVVASDAFAKISAGDFSAGVSAASLGLVIRSTGKTALEAKGTLAVTGGSFASVSATEVKVRYNDTNEAFTGQTIAAGGVSFTFGTMPAATSLTGVSLTGLAASFGDVFTIGGNFEVEKSGGDVKIVASSASAILSVSDFKVGVNNGVLGLVIKGNGEKAFEVDGDLVLEGAGFACTADKVKVLLNETGIPYIGQAISAGGMDFGFEELPGSTTIRGVYITGLDADFDSIFSISGNYGFVKEGTVVKAVATDASAILAAGSFSVGVNSADLGLIIDAAGKVALEAAGALSIQGGGFASVSASEVLVRYNNTGALYTGQKVSVGDVNYTFANLPASTTLKAVSVTGLEASLGGGLQIGGDFGFQADGTTMYVVAENARAYLGAGDFAVGVEDASLGLIIGATGRVLEARGGLFAEIGSDVSLSATTVSVRMNETGAAYTGTSISAGNVSYTFESMVASTTLKEVSVGGASVTVGGFVQASGSLAVRFSTDTLTLDDASAVAVDLLTVGGSDLSAFAGYNGGTDYAVGLQLTDVDFALVLVGEQMAAGRGWVAVEGSVGGASVVGVPGLTLAVTSFGLELNLAAADNTVVDFASSPLDVLVAPAATVTLNMDGAAGELIQVAGTVTIELADFFRVSGSFAFVSSDSTVRLSDGSSVDVDMITIGADSVTAFAGLNGGSAADKLGFDLTNADFAIALMTDQSNPAHKWMALKSEVGSVAFVGVDGLTVDADTLTIEINRNLGTEGSPVAQDPELTATRLKLETDISVGTLIFELEGDTAEVAVGLADTSLTMISKITSALESLTGVGVGNVEVSGTRADGFILIFNKALLGEDLSGIRVSALSPEVVTTALEKVAGLPAQDDVVYDIATENTELLLVTDIQVGTLKFTLRGETKNVAVASGTADAALVGLIQTALSSFTAVGVGNVTVAGTRAAGFTIEFVAAMAGEDFSDLALSILSPGVEASVSTVVKGGQVVTGKTTTGAYVREKQVISFSNGFRSTNTRYELEFNGLKTGLLDFSVNSPTYNRAILQAGLESLTTIKKGNVRVEFDQSSTSAAPRYFVYFIGTLAYQNVPQIVVVSSSNVTVAVATSVEGQGAVTTQTVTDVSAEQQVRVQSAATGTFTLSLLYDGATYTTSALAFTATAASVQSALNTAFSSLADASVTVTSTTAGVWNVAFNGTLAGKNLARMTVATTLAPVGGSLAIVQRGFERLESTTFTTAAVNELQRVSIEAQTGGTFTLALTYGGTTYTTEAIDFAASAAAVDSALTSAFSTLAVADFIVARITAGAWEVRLTGTLGGIDHELFKVVATPEVASASLTVEEVGKSLARPDIIPAADPNLVVDFGVQNLEVKTGPATTMKLNMDGLEGDLIRASGNMTLALFGFFTLEGGLAFEKSSETVKLADGTEVLADMLTIGGGGLSSFVGVNGGTADEVGLTLDELEFALVLLASRATPSRTWTALEATAGRIALVGIPDFTLEATSLAVNINDAGDGGSVVDFKTRNLTVLTGSGTSLTLTMDGARGELLEAEGTIDIDVAGFVGLSGTMAFSKTGANLVAVGTAVDASLTAGTAVNVTLANANFGLKAGDGTTAFELKDGLFAASISGLTDITATSVLVRYT